MNLGFLILIGLPGSGKTSLAKTLKNHIKTFKEISYYFIHICYDELIPFFNHGHGIEWKILRNSVALKVEELVVALKSKKKELCPTVFAAEVEDLQTFNSNIILIIDDNMHFKSMRYTLYQIARNHGIGFCQVFLNCSLELALLKNEERDPNSIVPRQIIEAMYTKLEKPNKKNNWEKYALCIDAFSNVNEVCSQLFPILIDSLHNFEYVRNDSKQRELSAVQCKKSTLHQSDLALRKIVGTKIKEFLSQSTNYDPKKYSLQLNAKRSEILYDIKTGNISLPHGIDEDQEKPELINFLSNYF